MKYGMKTPEELDAMAAELDPMGSAFATALLNRANELVPVTMVEALEYVGHSLLVGADILENGLESVGVSADA